MVTAGAGLFALAWAPAVVVAIARPTGIPAIPVAGPLLFLNSGPSRLYTAGFIVDAVAQLGGLVVAVVGLIRTETRYRYARPSLTLTPIVTPGLAGLSVVARF